MPGDRKTGKDRLYAEVLLQMSVDNLQMWLLCHMWVSRWQSRERDYVYTKCPDLGTSI